MAKYLLEYMTELKNKLICSVLWWTDGITQDLDRLMDLNVRCYCSLKDIISNHQSPTVRSTSRGRKPT